MKLNIKGIFKSVIAGATLIGGAILGNEARKCFTKPLPDEVDNNDSAENECTEMEATFTTDDEEETTEPDEVPED